MHKPTGELRSRQASGAPCLLRLSTLRLCSRNATHPSQATPKMMMMMCSTVFHCVD